MAGFGAGLKILALAVGENLLEVKQILQLLIEVLSSFKKLGLFGSVELVHLVKLFV